MGGFEIVDLELREGCANRLGSGGKPSADRIILGSQYRGTWHMWITWKRLALTGERFDELEYCLV